MVKAAFETEAAVATCKKNLALAIGIAGSVAGETGAGQVEALAVVLSNIQISCFKKAEEAVASATATLFNFKAVVSLGTTTTTLTSFLFPCATSVA